MSMLKVTKGLILKGESTSEIVKLVLVLLLKQISLKGAEQSFPYSAYRLSLPSPFERGSTH